MLGGVLVASPYDIGEERQVLARVVGELNQKWRMRSDAYTPSEQGMGAAKRTGVPVLLEEMLLGSGWRLSAHVTLCGESPCTYGPPIGR
jgi:hypothetical protein